mmetsp:Transcript_731/g.2949  ORF Transcript_731/g.2949 Transcript_731/m.2949 type:complete len:121 (-) Transcript_731:500-862(-)
MSKVVIFLLGSLAVMASAWGPVPARVTQLTSRNLGIRYLSENPNGEETGAAPEPVPEKKGFKLDYDPNAERSFLGIRKDYLKESLQDPEILLQLAFSAVIYGALIYFFVDTIRILSEKGG